MLSRDKGLSSLHQVKWKRVWNCQTPRNQGKILISYQESSLLFHHISRETYELFWKNILLKWCITHTLKHTDFSK